MKLCNRHAKLIQCITFIFLPPRKHYISIINTDRFMCKKMISLYPQPIHAVGKMPIRWSLMCVVQMLQSDTGRAIAQAVSHRFPNAGSVVRAQFSSCVICGGQSGPGAGFLRKLRFPLPILIPPTVSHSSSIIRGWYNRQISGRRTKWTQSHPTPRNYKKLL
jgi:hypothetical protein